MDGVLARLYARLGSRYLLVPVAFTWGSAMALAVLFVEVVASRYLGVQPLTVLSIVFTACVGLTVSIAIVSVILVRISKPVLDWTAGRREIHRPEDVWASAVRLPNRFVAVGMPFAVVSVLPAMTGLLNLVPLPWYSAFAIAVGVVLVVGMGLALNMAALIAFLRPVVAEIDAANPGMVMSRTTSSIRRRIVVASLLVVITSAWLTTGVTGRQTSPAMVVALTVAAALGIGLTFSLILTLALSQSLMDPINDLVVATRRIAAGDLTARVPLVSNDEFGHLASSFNTMVAGLAERHALHSALGTYVDPVVADRLLNEGEVLEGDVIDATILFVDIVAFTSRAEHMSPREVVSELNEFFQLLIPIISDHGGHTNKLLGDGFMAVFGAPVPLDDHADRAVDAAHDIQTAIRERYGDGLRAGVGVNSGPVVVGTTGGGTKLDFTVIGDAVNVASRVEALTRETGDDILLTAATKDSMSRADRPLLPRGHTSVKGRIAQVHIYATPARRID